jgi:ribonucleotide reductase class II
MTSPFRLDPTFVASYKDREPPFGFNGLGLLVYLRTYSRVKPDGGKEQWYETIERVVNGCYNMQKRWIESHQLGWSDAAGQESAQEMYDRMWTMKFLPPGRGLWAMGSPITEERGVYAALNNCFAGDTKFFADGHLTTFKEVVGKNVNVLTKDGRWLPAEVRSFGRQMLQRVTFKVPTRTNYAINYAVTPNHRWLLADGKETTTLKVGDKILLQPATADVTSEDYARGFMHGVIFGDGTRNPQYPHRFFVRLCGKKAQYRSQIERYSHLEPTTTDNGDPIITVVSNEVDLKALPLDETSHSYKRGFVVGWTAMDAYRKPNENQSYSLDTQDRHAATWFVSHAGMLGYSVTGWRVDSSATNYGERSAPLNRISYTEQTTTYKVTTIEPLSPQEVFCVTEPVTSSFTLEYGLPTGNCAFVSTAQIERDLAKPFTFLMDMSMLGVGVGFDTKGAGHLYIQEPDANTEDHYIIPDTREGWVEALKRLLDSYFIPGYNLQQFDYSLVRPAGLPIRGFGGTASGPAPLKEMLEAIRAILDKERRRTISITAIVDIMNLIGRCVVAGNVRRCLPGDALVHTKGGLIPIRDVKVGMEALTPHGYNKVTDHVVQGVQQLVKIVTQDGEFRCTPTHRMAVLQDIEGNYEWVSADRLKEGDRLMTSRVAIPGTKTSLPAWSYDGGDHSTTCKEIVVPELDTGMAWFMGLFHGDGYTYPNFKNNGFNAYVSLVFGLHEGHIAAKAQAQLQRFGKDLHVTLRKRSGENSLMVHCQSKQMAWYMAKNVKTANTPLKVPEWILRGTIEVRQAYLAGVLDSDGCASNRPVSVVSTVYPEWARELQALLYSCGVESRLSLDRTAPSCKENWQPQSFVSLITMRSVAMFSKFPELMKELRVGSRSQNGNGFPKAWCDFMPGKIKSKTGYYGQKFKQLTVDVFNREFNDLDFCPLEVKSVIPDVEEETFDISVENDHCFYVNGLCSHNTAEICFGDPDSQEFINLKNYERNPQREAHGWASNNSIFAEVGMDYSKITAQIARNGEPGLAWLNNMQEYSRMNGIADYKDRRVMGGNPCVSADTMVLTDHGLVAVRELVGKQFTAVVDGRSYPSTVKGFWKTAEDQPLLRLQLDNGSFVRCTANHQILTTGEKWVEAGKLKAGMEVVLSENTDFSWSGGAGTEMEGYVLGQLVGDGTFITNKQGNAAPIVTLWLDPKYQHKHDYAPLKLIEEYVLNQHARSDFQGFSLARTGTNGHREYRVKCAYLTELAERFGVLPREKRVPEHGSVEFTTGLLRGFFDADGTVTGDQRKGVSVRLRQVDMERLEAVQRLLLALGVACKIFKERQKAGERQMPDQQGGMGTYTCHELVIANKSLFRFRDRIGFWDNDKKARLDLLLGQYQHKPNRSKFYSKVLVVTPDGREDVYDATIPGVSRFTANGIIVHNCLEQSLEAYELCCLVETFPCNSTGREDFLRTLKFAYLYAKTVTLGRTHWSETNRVLLRNRRIGCSMSGIAQFITKYGVEELREWCEEGYGVIQHYDEIYANWLCVPRSIKTTSVKPSGTVSLLAGATPGMHYPESRFYIRRMRLADNSPLLSGLKAGGYHLEPDSWSPGTMVVEVPIDAGAGIRTTRDVSMWEQLSLAAFLQRHWADNQVSSTITFDPVTEGGQIEHALNYFQYQLKGISFLPRAEKGAYKQMPYEAITEEVYHARVALLKKTTFQDTEDAIGEKGCDGTACSLVH